MAGTSGTKSSSLRINLSGTRYSVVRVVAEEMGMTIVEDDADDCDLYWIDAGVPLEKYINLKPYQVINHFSGMGDISRKDSLARNIQKMKRVCGKEFDIIPMTWILPSEYTALCCFMSELKKRRQKKTFIVKPPNGSMGNGIKLIRSSEQIPQGESLVVQEYIDKPLLMEEFKFDLRVYALLLSCSPLRIFMYNDGLVRLSTCHYSLPTAENLDQHFMHLTNYSVNKHSKDFDDNDSPDRGSKRTLKYFTNWLSRNGYNAAEVWSQIKDIIVKTLIVAQPSIQHSYQACRPGTALLSSCQCFEILGFDILLDENLRPWLLEVNRSPSFGTDSRLDLQIKQGVLKDALNLIFKWPPDRQQRIMSMDRMNSRRRLLAQTPESTLRGSSVQPYDFLWEQDQAFLELERKREAVKSRLMQLKKEKELEAHEEQFKGEYTRIFPSFDIHKQHQYETLVEDITKAAVLGKGAMERRRSRAMGLKHMREKELLELLSQYESEERFGFPAASKQWSEEVLAYKSLQPLAVHESSPLEAEYAAMAAREHEEEQTQRTMLALNNMPASYPNKSLEEVKQVVQDLQENWSTHSQAVRIFWTVTLDSTKRKNLLTPLKESIQSLLHCFWRTSHLECVRLHKVFVRLFNFLLSNHGQGLWSSFPGASSDSWESVFKKRADVLTMTELQCCRRATKLCQYMVLAAYHYHQRCSKKQKPFRQHHSVLLHQRYSDAASPLSRPITVHQERSYVPLRRRTSRSMPVVFPAKLPRPALPKFTQS